MDRSLVVIQARKGSSRLPNKVLLPLAGSPLLLRVVERVMAARRVQGVVVATTTDAIDDEVEALCAEERIPCFRGHPTDLLDRHYQAAREFGAEHVAKIPSDCPMIDPAAIDRVFEAYEAKLGQVDYVSNLHPNTYPDGHDVEIVPFSVLETAWKEAKRDFEREHTTPFIWEQPERFRLANIAWETGKDYSMSHRWTIDYPEDYAFIQRVYEELGFQNPCFGIDDVLKLIERKPEIQQLNAKYAGVNWYRHHLGELRTIQSSQTKTLS